MEMSQQTQGDKNSADKEKEKQTFPKTSAQVIGWKASKAATHTYGIPESRARGKCDVLRVLQWPHEGL